MMRECRICPDACCSDYHQASNSIRDWLRERLRLALNPVEPGKRGNKHLGGNLKEFPREIA